MQKKFVLLLITALILPFFMLAQTEEAPRKKREKKKRKSKTEAIVAQPDTMMRHQLDSLFHLIEDLKKKAEATKPQPAIDSSAFYTDTIIQWQTIEKGMQAQRSNNKKVLVYIHANWCKWCKLSDDSVFINKEIAHYINQNYNPVILNCEDPNPLFFKGKQFNYIDDPKRNVHELSLYFLNNKQTYPGYVILDKDGSILQSETGYMEPAYLEMFLNYYASDGYLHSDIKSFDGRFGGKIKY